MEEISFAMSVDELLQLWGKHAYGIISGKASTSQDIENRRKINTLLISKGITDLEIFKIEDQTMTLRYRLKGNLLSTSLDIGIEG